MRNNRTRRRERPAPMFESLEPRLLLSGSWTGTDVDGDALAVTLIGPGSMAVAQPALVAGNPGILKITLTDVEGSQTTLAIKVTKRPGGDGYVNVGRITGGPNCGLHALDAPTTNIVGTATQTPPAADDGSGYGIDLEGYVKTFNVHNITNGMDVRAKQGSYYLPTSIPTTFTAWDIGQDTTVTLGSWVEALKVHSWDVGGNLDVKGLTKLDATGDFGAGITLFRGPTAGPITIGGSVLSTAAKPTDWVFPTDVGAITVGSGTAWWNIIAAAAAMPSLTSKGDLSFGMLHAVSLTTLSVTGNLPVGTLALTQGVDPAKKALGTATIGKTIGNAGPAGGPFWTISGDVGAITVGASGDDWFFSTPGAVKSLTCKGDLAFGTWTALSLGTLAVTGNAASGQMTLTQAADPKKPALGTASIGKTIGNAGAAGAPVWTFSGDVGAITIGASNNDWIFEALGAVKSLTCKGDLAFSIWEALSLGTLAVTGNQTSGMMFLSQAVGSAKPALGSATIGGQVASGGAVTWTVVGNVGAITIGSATGGWTVGVDGNVASLTVKASLALADWRSLTLGTLKVTGDMDVAVMRLQSTNTACNSAAIGGWLNSSTIRAAGSIGSFKAKGMNVANLFAGVDPLGSTGTVTNFSARIGSVNVTGKAPPQPSNWMIGSEIRAGILGSAFIQGPLENSGNVLAARTIAPNVLKIRRFDGVSYTYNSNWPADAAARLNVVIL